MKALGRIVAAICLCLFGAAGSAPSALEVLASLPPPEVRMAPGLAALPAPLSPADAERYRRIFELQTEGSWDEADRLIRRLDDRVLLGHVQAQRYLHPTAYRSRYRELRDWMGDYHDHPQARRIYKLAMRRKPADWRAPKQPTGSTLKGYGTDRPRQWSARPPIRDKSAAARKLRQRIRARINDGGPSSAHRLLRSGPASGELSALSRAEAQAEIAHGHFIYGKRNWTRTQADELALELAETALSEAGSRVSWAHWPAGLAAWRLGRYVQAHEHFAALADSEKMTAWARAAGAFWASRTAAALKLRRGAEHFDWLRQATTFGPTFYGLLAREKLGIEKSFDWSLPPLNETALETLEEARGYHRAMALFQIGRTAAAERELRRLYHALPAEGRPALMTIATRQGQAGLAIRIAGLLCADGHRDHYAALYPLPDWNLSPDGRIDDALLFSIVRQESWFNPDAKSGRGARGLMQIMPRTAAFVGEDDRLGGRDKGKLFDPDTNLKLGSAYLRHLMDHPDIGGNLFHVAAAYNAGPGNLAKWRRNVEFQNDPLLFIESIPSHETRNFIESVLAGFWLYRMRMGQPVPSLKMAAVYQWPVYRPQDQLAAASVQRDGRH